MPRSEFITLLHGDIRGGELQAGKRQTDLVLSTSVFEHLEDVPGVIKALAALTVPNGFHLHFIDLRDHYFIFPYEMLTFPEVVWKHFLNPTSNLNRMRISGYQTAFGAYFRTVEIIVLSSEHEAFGKIHQRIKPEFKSGDLAIDSATLIQLTAENPIRSSI